MRIIERINEEVLAKTARRCRERDIVIPTFEELRNPELIPDTVKERLAGVGLWDVNPLNLYRITWKNDQQTGLYGGVNYMEFPESLTGVPCRIVGLVGRIFPTGAHKVGAAFGCLVPRLVSGTFDPTTQKAVWPSTGNFCRGGAFDCALLACTAVAILPEEMSRERFEWLKEIGAEVIATPGCESNVKEIYDKCWEIKRTREDCVIFNQFEEFGNAIYHYSVTGEAMEELFGQIGGERARFAAYISATGSAGTIAAGDFLRTKHPQIKVAATEALQCPTLLRNGFGGHRIEGIGDKHVPWVHNSLNTDMVIAVDDEACMSLLRLMNEPEGKEYLKSEGVDADVVAALPTLGISGICNLIASVKLAKYYELGPNDMIFTVLTDSMDLYQSRVNELRDGQGPYSTIRAAGDSERYLRGAGMEHMAELGYWDRKKLHNLKYYTWVEQQGRTVEELNALWDPDFWEDTFSQVTEWDDYIREFNSLVRG